MTDQRNGPRGGSLGPLVTQEKNQDASSKTVCAVLALLAGAGRALRRHRMRRAMIPLMQFDERMLRDIGLSRSDVIACLTAPDSGGMLEVRARRQAANIANASGDGLRRAA